MRNRIAFHASNQRCCIHPLSEVLSPTCAALSFIGVSFGGAAVAQTSLQCPLAAPGFFHLPHSRHKHAAVSTATTCRICWVYLAGGCICWVYLAGGCQLLHLAASLKPHFATAECAAAQLAAAVWSAASWLDVICVAAGTCPPARAPTACMKSPACPQAGSAQARHAHEHTLRMCAHR